MDRVDGSADADAAAEPEGADSEEGKPGRDDA
jgi:hypothetical protein